jgi:hypothetical protein
MESVKRRQNLPETSRNIDETCHLPVKTAIFAGHERPFFRETSRNFANMTSAQMKARGLTKHPGGRPTNRTPENCQKLLEIVRTGLPLKFAAASIGVSYASLNEWREQDPAFSEKVELARVSSVKDRWDLIQAAARGNGNTPGDWKAAAWSLERTWASDFSRPEVQLNVLQNNTTNVTNQISVTFEMAEKADSRSRILEAEIEKLIENRLPPAPPL